MATGVKDSVKFGDLIEEVVQRNSIVEDVLMIFEEVCCHRVVAVSYD